MWGDLLMLEVEESYRALPRKTLAGMDFVLNRFLTILYQDVAKLLRLPDYNLVIKMDDDLEIR